MELFSLFFKAKQNPLIYLICFFGCARVLVAACRIFSGNMWDLVPWPGIEHWPFALGAQSLSHWTRSIRIMQCFSLKSDLFYLCIQDSSLLLCVWVIPFCLSVVLHCMIYMAACLPIHPWVNEGNLKVNWRSFKVYLGTFLEVQWLRICLPMQGTLVWSLVCEDSTCRGATKPMRWDCWGPHP